jgi:hypothetical protein
VIDRPAAIRAVTTWPYVPLYKEPDWVVMRGAPGSLLIGSSSSLAGGESIPAEVTARAIILLSFLRRDCGLSEVDAI